MSGDVSVYAFIKAKNIEETFSKCFKLLDAIITISGTAAKAKC